MMSSRIAYITDDLSFKSAILGSLLCVWAIDIYFWLCYHVKKQHESGSVTWWLRKIIFEIICFQNKLIWSYQKNPPPSRWKKYRWKFIEPIWLTEKLSLKSALFCYFSAILFPFSLDGFGFFWWFVGVNREWMKKLFGQFGLLFCLIQDFSEMVGIKFHFILKVSESVGVNFLTFRFAICYNRGT